MKPISIIYIKWLFCSAIVLAVLRLLQIPFTTALYSLIIGLVGFLFSPVQVIVALVDSRLNGNGKVFSMLVCFYVAMICGHSAIFHLLPDTSLAYQLFSPILSVLLFAASEFMWKRSNAASKMETTNLRTFGWWFLPLVAYPLLYRFIVN